MDISVVSGTYNRLPYLQRMVESVRASVAPVLGLEYEIVLVDGGSTDTTIEWCKSQPDIRLIEHGELRGAVKAFNDGAFIATGRYVIMANDDIEFVGNSIPVAYAYMETHPLCGGGCFYQDRGGGDWHVNGMQAVQVISKGKGRQTSVYYAQVGIFRKWLGDRVHWWCDESEFAMYLTKSDYREINDGLIGLHTYGGDNELSARIWDLGFTIDPVPGAKISDKEAKDDLRTMNNISGSNDPRSVRGAHPDSLKWGRKWYRRNHILGYSNYDGPILKDKPMINSPVLESGKERVLYLPLFEQGWQVQKEQKLGLRDALARRAIVWQLDYMESFAKHGKLGMMAVIQEMCTGFKPTIFLSQLHNADQINAGDIGNLKGLTGPGCRFVNWNGDYWPDQLLRQDGLDLARAFHLMLTVNRDVQEKHQLQKINTHYCQSYVYPAPIVPLWRLSQIVYQDHPIARS